MHPKIVSVFKFMLWAVTVCLETGISCYPTRKEGQNQFGSIYTHMQVVQVHEKYRCKKFEDKENLFDFYADQICKRLFQQTQTSFQLRESAFITQHTVAAAGWKHYMHYKFSL